MLVDLEGEADADLHLLWPTAYAAPVLRAAVAVACAEADDAPDNAAARSALESAEATLCAFYAVDNGGLQEVDL